jgi:hypothetical protein
LLNHPPLRSRPTFSVVRSGHPLRANRPGFSARPDADCSFSRSFSRSIPEPPRCSLLPGHPTLSRRSFQADSARPRGMRDSQVRLGSPGAAAGKSDSRSCVLSLLFPAGLSFRDLSFRDLSFRNLPASPLVRGLRACPACCSANRILLLQISSFTSPPAIHAGNRSVCENVSLRNDSRNSLKKTASLEEAPRWLNALRTRRAERFSAMLPTAHFFHPDAFLRCSL